MSQAAGLLIRCPHQDCKREDGKPRHLARLAARGPGSSWVAFEDPVDAVKLYACPVHGRYEVGADGVPHKPRRR